MTHKVRSYLSRKKSCSCSYSRLPSLCVHTRLSPQQLFGLKKKRGKNLLSLVKWPPTCFIYYINMSAHMHTHMRASEPWSQSKLLVKFSQGGTSYHLSYPPHQIPRETSCVRSPSITWLLFTPAPPLKKHMLQITSENMTNLSPSLQFRNANLSPGQ